MKTPEEILKEKFGTAYKHLNVEQICECIETYHNQFHPTPTEAEINEAAENGFEKHYRKSTYDRYFISMYYDRGFKDAINWLKKK